MANRFTELAKHLQQRADLGYQRYGTYLCVNNGRNALVDAYQEALDQIVYLRQYIHDRYTSVELTFPYDYSTHAEPSPIPHSGQPVLSYVLSDFMEPEQFDRPSGIGFIEVYRQAVLLADLLRMLVEMERVNG